MEQWKPPLHTSRPETSQNKKFNYTRFMQRVEKLYKDKYATEFAKFMGEQIAQIYIEENGRTNTDRSAAWAFAHRWMTGMELSLPIMFTFGRKVHRYFEEKELEDQKK